MNDTSSTPLIPDPVAYDVSVCIHEPEIDAVPFGLFGPGARVKPLRRHASGALRSGIVTLPPGWQSAGTLRLDGVIQLFVRTGALQWDGQALAAGAFVAVPAGAVVPPLASAQGANLIVILDSDESEDRPPAPIPTSPEAGGQSEAILHPDVFAITPVVPVIAGKPLEGFERRVLWENPLNGADTRLLRIPAGFEGRAGPNYHPVEEEIFCLEGDIAPDESRPMVAGSFLWNPRLSVHGFREHSRGGCVLLEWHDGAWAFHCYDGGNPGTA